MASSPNDSSAADVPPDLPPALAARHGANPWARPSTSEAASYDGNTIAVDFGAPSEAPAIQVATSPSGSGWGVAIVVVLLMIAMGAFASFYFGFDAALDSDAPAAVAPASAGGSLHPGEREAVPLGEFVPPGDPRLDHPAERGKFTR